MITERVDGDSLISNRPDYLTYRSTFGIVVMLFSYILTRAIKFPFLTNMWSEPRATLLEVKFKMISVEGRQVTNEGNTASEQIYRECHF